ncbi:MAG: MFS transporter [Myxococcota bacterium]
MDVPSRAPDSLSGQLRVLLSSKVFNLANLMEMLERLAYYGLRTVLPVYMVLAIESGGPQFDHVQKGWVYGWWALIQSIVPMVCGGLADRYGYKLTVGVAIFFKAIGYVVMAYCVELGAVLSSGASTGVPGHPMVLYVFFSGAMLLAFGTGVFKPGLQGMISLSMPAGTTSLGWAVFYQLVNVGGFLGPILAGVMRLMDWKYVFLSCAVIVCLNYFVLLMFAEPAKDGDGYGEDPWYLVMTKTAVGVFQPRLFCFIILFSGFWLMFFQLFDLLPNFIDDWVDSRGIYDALAKPLFAAFGSTPPEQWNSNVPQEYLINFNAGMCMTLAFLAGYLTRNMRPVIAMAMGIGFSCLAIYSLGISQSGWVVLTAILGFSIGEITASPRKADYLASLAPKGYAATYLGYVNATQAVGWSIGSVVAGQLYQEQGDKVVLARRMLVERFGRDAADIAQMPKTSVLPELQQALSLPARETIEVLWNTYSPNAVWTVFALIGLSSMIGLFVYGWLVKKIGDRSEGIYVAFAVGYTWLIYDQLGVPMYSVLFGTLVGMYVLLRKYVPGIVPVSAQSE